MAKQYEYLLYTPGCTIGRKPYCYDYGQTKGIRLYVKKEGFHISMHRSRAYKPDEILQERTFQDAIKKAYLLQLVQYGRCCNVKTLIVSTNGGANTLSFDNEDRLLYPLCGDKLRKPLDESWKNDQVIERIITTPKSGFDRRFAALFAFVMSRSKAFETERFMHLWMSLNAIYGVAAETARNNLPKEWIKKEYAQIKFFSVILGYPYRAFNRNSTIEEKKENDHIRFSLERICASIPSECIPSFVEACRNDDRSN